MNEKWSSDPGQACTPPAAEARRKAVVGGAAISAVAVFNGVGEPTVGGLVPALRVSARATRGIFGLLIAGFPFGLMLGGLLATRYSDRLGARRTLLVGGGLYWTPLLGIGAVLLAKPAPSIVAVAVIVLWTMAGVGNGLMDGSQSAEATEFAARHSKVSILHFQAAQGVGTLAGASGALLALTFGFPPAAELLLAGACALGFGLLGARLVPEYHKAIKGGRGGASSVQTEQQDPSDVNKPTVGFGTLILLGLLVSAFVVPLGIVINWSTTLALELHGPRWMIGGTLIPFAVAQVAAQFVGATFHDRLGAFKLALVGAVINVCGVLLIVDAVLRLPHPIPANYHAPVSVLSFLAAGFLAVGLGTATIPGFVQDAVNNVNVRGLGNRGKQSFVATLQYGGQTGAPGLLGVISDSTSYGTAGAFTVILGICTIIGLLFIRLIRYADWKPAEADPRAQAGDLS